MSGDFFYDARCTLEKQDSFVTCYNVFPDNKGSLSTCPLPCILETLQDKMNDGKSFAMCIEKVIQFDFECFMHCAKLQPEQYRGYKKRVVIKLTVINAVSHF